MSFDEMYDEILHGEFSSRGKHQAAVQAEPEPVQSKSRGRHAAAETAERPRGFQRYRTAGLVGAGGLACAAAGAFLGGLGGYFAISPAAAHAVGASTITQDLPLAQAVSHAAHSSSPGALGTSAVTAADFSKVTGSLTQGIAPFATLTSLPLQNGVVTGFPLTYEPVGSGAGGGGTNGGTSTPIGVIPVSPGGGGGGGVTGCVSGSSDLGLSCILSSLTGALGNLGSLTGSNPGSTLNGLVPSLDGVVSDVTGTLQNLTALLPIASLPLPTGGLPTTVLAGTAAGPVTGGPATTSGAATSNPVTGALAPVLNTVGAVTGALGSTAPSVSSLPLPTSGTTVPSLPSLPVSVPTIVPTQPAVPVVSAPSNGSSSGGSNTVNVPLPVPVPVNTPTISIGGLSVGISSSGSKSGSGSGLTLTLP